MNLLLFIFQNNCFSMLSSYVDIINVVILNADKWTLPACFCCILLVSCLGKFLTVLIGLQLFSADRKYLSCLDHYSYVCCLLHAFCLISPVNVSFWNYFWHAVFFTLLMPTQCSDKLGLSLELGSFAAGVMISTTDLAQHTLEQVCFFALLA